MVYTSCYIDIRILQNMIPLILGLSTRISDPSVYVAFWAPTFAMNIPIAVAIATTIITTLTCPTRIPLPRVVLVLELLPGLLLLGLLLLLLLLLRLLLWLSGLTQKLCSTPICHSHSIHPCEDCYSYCGHDCSSAMFLSTVTDIAIVVIDITCSTMLIQHGSC